MKCGFAASAVALALALALPANAQHAAPHGAGSSPHSGFASHSGGYSAPAHPAFAHPGFSRSGGFSRPAAPRAYPGFSGSRPAVPGRARSGFPPPRFIRPGFGPSGLASRQPSYTRAGESSPHRPRYRPAYGDRAPERNGGRHRRNPWYAGSYVNGYPFWSYPYPFVIDSGFYDWESPADSYDQGAASPDSVPYVQRDGDYGPAIAADPPQPYPSSAFPDQSAMIPVGAPLEEPLTLIFKDGRAPRKMQNYIMNARALTDMDHFDRIPIDQIDVAATEQFNRAHGVDFEVPPAARE